MFYIVLLYNGALLFQSLAWLGPGDRYTFGVPRVPPVPVGNKIRQKLRPVMKYITDRPAGSRSDEDYGNDGWWGPAGPAVV